MHNRASSRWRREYPEKNRISKLKSRMQHPGTDRKYREDHKERQRENQAKWYLANRKRHITNTTAYKKRRMESDPVYRMIENLKGRYRSLFKGVMKNKISARDRPKVREAFGLDLESLMKHMEVYFYPNPDTGEQMTRENYGYRGWHVDHIKPLAAFSFDNCKTEEEFLRLSSEAWHYTNLRPMWAKENMSKSSKFGGRVHRFCDSAAQ
jgi:hypothetical protein